MKTTDKNRILQQIAAIPTMERGKLSTYTLKDRSPTAGPYYRLQYWQNGKNHSRYVSHAELPAVQAAIAGHTQFCQLTEQYAELIIADTRQNIADVKKKDLAPEILLAQDEEIQGLITRFQAQSPQGTEVAQLEVLVRTAVFKSANVLVGWLL